MSQLNLQHPFSKYNERSPLNDRMRAFEILLLLFVLLSQSMWFYKDYKIFQTAEFEKFAAIRKVSRSPTELNSTAIHPPFSYGPLFRLCEILSKPPRPSSPVHLKALWRCFCRPPIWSYPMLSAPLIPLITRVITIHRAKAHPLLFTVPADNILLGAFVSSFFPSGIYSSSSSPST